MGHESSKSVESSPPPDSTVVKGSRRSRLKQRLKGSRRSRFEQRLHLYSESRRRRLSGTSGSSTLSKLPSAEDFAGIALLTLIRAEMNFKDKWLACVSFGEQTFRTEVSDHTDKPVWNSEKKLLLENSGPCVARISVFETNKLSRNNLIGYRELDLFDFLAQDSEPECEVFDLLHPLSPGIVAGNISLSCCIEDPVETQKSFARRILAIVAYNEDGTLSLLEFSKLMEAFGNKVAAAKVVNWILNAQFFHPSCKWTCGKFLFRADI